MHEPARILPVAWDDPRAEALRREFLAEMDERYPDTPPELAALFGTDAAVLHGAWIALVDDEPAGHVAMMSATVDGAVELRRLHVTPRFRRRGVAMALIREVEAAAREHGAARVVLETGPRQPDAEALYERYGFARIPNYPPFDRKPDQLCYGLELAGRPGRLASIRRYPVKAMGGEALDRAEVDARGIVGDRTWAALDSEGRLATGKNSQRFRRYDAVFDYGATTGDAGAVCVARHDGGTVLAAGDPALDAELSTAFGAPVRLLPEHAHGAPGDFYDEGAVSLVGSATLAWVERELGADAVARRIRANLVIETSEPFEEEAWLGRRLRIGEVEVIVEWPITRCRMVDLAQDGVPAPASLLKALGATRGAKLGVYCRPTRPGAIAVGDAVTLA